MALSVVDLYAKILPKTNCGDCGYPTCIAFAGMVVSEKLPLKNCPYILPDILGSAQKELDAQYKEGKWLKKDMAKEALEWAKKRAASMELKDISQRIGGKIIDRGGEQCLCLPYFNRSLFVTMDKILDNDGEELSRNEQTFVYIHMAQGGDAQPTGNMKSFKEFPNTVSKMVTMKNRVEVPLCEAFSSNLDNLKSSVLSLGAKILSDDYPSCDFAAGFRAFPKIPVVLMFWDTKDGFDAEARLLFDETIIQHLDIESIMFLSEYLCEIILDSTP